MTRDIYQACLSVSTPIPAASTPEQQAVWIQPASLPPCSVAQCSSAKLDQVCCARQSNPEINMAANGLDVYFETERTVQNI